MFYSRPFRLSKKRIREYIEQMNHIKEFCEINGIARTSDSDGYYFVVNGQPYRVGNSLYAKEAFVYDPVSGKHIETDDTNTIYFYASKTRIIDIYNDIIAGYELDGHGRRKGQVSAK